YERPLEASIGDVPVVSFVIDTSGSMIQDISEQYGSRIHNVKNLLRQFVHELPSDVQMQLSEFSEEVRIVQALTTDKMKILRGLGRLEASGGTDITGAVLASYKTLKEIPSTKKVLVFITDAALDTTHPDNDFFRELLAEIKEDDINILWVGLGIEEGSEDFRLAAEITGGAYIVSEDIDLLTERFNAVLRDVRESPRSGLSNIYIGVEKINALGARESYATGKLAELAPIKKSGEIVVSQTIKYTTGSMLCQYDADTAAKLSGNGIPAQDTVITNRMQVDRTGASDALKVTVDGIFFMNRLTGVDAPSGYRYMALTLQLENILAPQEVTVYPDGSSHPASWLGGGAKGETKWLEIPYMIPDFTAHFALSYNDEGAYPGSLATWLTAQSLPVPGDTALTVMPDETRPGTLVFLVPDMEMEQAALHFYDTNYGHIDIPLVGEMRHMPYELPVWPKQEPANLSDTFALEITGYHEISQIPGTGQAAGNDEMTQGLVPGAGAVFKVVEGNFTAQVQALLNIDPVQRFMLRISSGSGDFYLPVSPATGLLPAGFCYPRMIAPGSFNKVRWLFEVPEGIREHAADLFVDLSDDDKTAAITSGGQFPGQLNARFTSDYFDVTVNQLVRKEDGINDHSGAYVIADITIHDKKDGYATSGIDRLFSVVSDEFFTAPVDVDDEAADGLNLDDEASHTGLDNFAQGTTGAGSSETSTVPASLTGDLILGFTDDSVVFDGTSRRGLLVFRCIDDEQDTNWYLYAHLFQDLKIKVGGGAFDSSLLGEKTIYDEDNTFAQELNAAIALAVDAYRLRHPDKSAQLTDGTIPLDGLETDKQAVPVPSVCLYGAEQLD
ncbi:MAG: VWA domain-containing protein, partial [Kiritimatiellae bacterium]|nr:VWA domain-containing protein [Kiritimatiellia bacterium]